MEQIVLYTMAYTFDPSPSHLKQLYFHTPDSREDVEFGITKCHQNLHLNSLLLLNAHKKIGKITDPH